MSLSHDGGKVSTLQWVDFGAPSQIPRFALARRSAAFARRPALSAHRRGPVMSGVFGIGLSGLQAAQAGLRVTSQNIANANTPGYVRAELQLTNATVGGQGGVQIDGVRRAADQFLSRIAQQATGASAGAQARAEALDRAQALFGDPTDSTSLFTALDRVFAGFAEVSLDPGSTIRRASAADNIDRFFSTLNSAAQGLQDLIREVDSRIADTAARAQGHLDTIAQLNIQIGQSTVEGADSSTAQNAIGLVLDDLAKILDIRVTPARNGGVEVRTAAGLLLVGEGASRLTHQPGVNDYASHNPVQLIDASGSSFPIDAALRTGELKGLIDARDKDLKGMAEALGGFAAAVAEGFNVVHNENAGAPAAASLVGRQTGLAATDRLNFTGESVIGLFNSSGVLVDRLTIDFDAGTITRASTAAAVSFINQIGPNGADGLVDRLNALLGAVGGGSASFTGGVLTLDGGANGVVVQQSAADPSDRAGRGFGHFFGLNDLIRRDDPGFFEAGASAADTHRLIGGRSMVFRITDASGAVAAERTVSIAGPLAAAGSTWGDLVTQLNATGTAGIGQFADVAFDPAQGRIVINPRSGYGVELVLDDTARQDNGVSVSGLFGLSHVARAARAGEFTVRPDIAGNPDKLSLARPDLSAALNTRVLEAGDTRGAIALNAVREMARPIPSAGMMSAQNASLSTYAARFGGEIGRRAQQAERESTAANAVATAAIDRRSSVEGVSIDDELVMLTTYQQSYAASARVIQAATEMMDLLMRLGA